MMNRKTPRTLLHVLHLAVLLSAAGAATSLSAATPASGEAWRGDLVQGLCQTYLGPPEASAGACLDLAASEIGRRLAEGGADGVPAKDIAVLALLLADRPQPAEASPPDEDARRTAQAGQDGEQGQQAQVVEGAKAQESEDAQLGESAFTDIGKGQEGYRQGVDRLSRMPLSERMVVTGDITSGMQAATVSNVSDLTSTFGRARVNFVSRAVPGSNDGRWSEGYFFVQMVAAGGPFDSSAVGGPTPFSALNGVATSRSAFNEGGARGNLYLNKAFYQQQVQLGRNDSIRGRVGVIDITDFFDANEFANNEARQFLSNAFVNSPAFKGGVSAPGLMGEYRRDLDRDWLDGIVLRTGYAITRTARAFTSPIWTNEVELQTRFGGRSGKYRFGSTLGNVPLEGPINGFHLSFDQWISNDMGVYARYANSNSGPGSLALGPVDQSFGGGVQLRFVDQSEHVSAWGFGFSQSTGIQNEMRSPSERALETYYRWQVTNNFSLTPDLQLVFGSGGNRTGGTHGVAGVRMTFGF